MKAIAIWAIAAACVLSGCTKTTDGVLAQTIEPVSAAGMTCEDFSTLGERDRETVVDEILGAKGAQVPVFVPGLAQVVCNMVPDASLEEILSGLG